MDSLRLLRLLCCHLLLGYGRDARPHRRAAGGGYRHRRRAADRRNTNHRSGRGGLLCHRLLDSLRLLRLLCRHLLLGEGQGDGRSHRRAAGAGHRHRRRAADRRPRDHRSSRGRRGLLGSLR